MGKRNVLGVVGLAVRLARKCGADVELGERTFAFLEKAVARGMVEQDYSLLYRDFEKIRKTGSFPLDPRKSYSPRRTPRNTHPHLNPPPEGEDE